MMMMIVMYDDDDSDDGFDAVCLFLLCCDVISIVYAR